MKTVGKIESVFVVTHEEFDEFVNDYFNTRCFDSAASEQTREPIFLTIGKAPLSDWDRETISILERHAMPHNAVETILYYLVNEGVLPPGNYVIVD